MHPHEHGANLIAVNIDGRLSHIAARFLHGRRAQSLVGGIVVHDGAIFVAHLHVNGIVQNACRRRSVQGSAIPIAMGGLVALRYGIGRGIGNALHIFARIGLEVLLPYKGKHGNGRKHRDKGNGQHHQHDALVERKVQTLLLSRVSIWLLAIRLGPGGIG